MIRDYIAFAILVAFLSACTPFSPRSSEKLPSIENDRKAIEMLREKELIAFNSGDVQGFVDIVTDDVVFDSPNRPPAIGKDAISSLCKVVFERFNYDATYTTDELIIEGNWAFDRGIWTEKRTPKEGGPETVIPFGMMQIYQRQGDDSWKLARSIWNMK